MGSTPRFVLLAQRAQSATTGGRKNLRLAPQRFFLVSLVRMTEWLEFVNY